MAMEVQNIVGSGKLDTELDLLALADVLGEEARYEPEMYPGMYLRVDGEDGPLTTVYRTGKFIVVGVTSLRELDRVRDAAVDVLADKMNQPLGIEWFRVQNFVCSGDLCHELNLGSLTVGLGLERSEYEPEQFPGLLYDPETADCTVMLFHTGKVIVAGAPTQEEAEDAFREVTERVETLLV